MHVSFNSCAAGLAEICNFIVNSFETYMCVEGILYTLRLSYLSIGTMNQKLKYKLGYIYTWKTNGVTLLPIHPNPTQFVSINKSQCFLYGAVICVCLFIMAWGAVK